MSKIKTEMDVEKLLQWAFVDELSKRKTSAAEGIWDYIEQYGQRGGIDPGHGAAQRYSHLGLPDEDAEAIERAVAKLDDTAFDWRNNFDDVVGDLAGLVSVNDSQRLQEQAQRTTVAGWTDKKTGEYRRVENRPRDVLLLKTIRTAVLVTSHAIMQNRPGWWNEEPRPYMIQAAKGPHAKIIGTCEAKNRYSLGAYCPLQWEPSPTSVLEARADYVVWWRALQKLAATLELQHHIALPPAAAEFPWLGELDNVGEVHRTNTEFGSLVLPLKPQRDRASAPIARPSSGPVRYPLQSETQA